MPPYLFLSFCNLSFFPFSFLISLFKIPKFAFPFFVPFEWERDFWRKTMLLTLIFRKKSLHNPSYPCCFVKTVQMCRTFSWSGDMNSAELETNSAVFQGFGEKMLCITQRFYCTARHWPLWRITKMEFPCSNRRKTKVASEVSWPCQWRVLVERIILMYHGPGSTCPSRDMKEKRQEKNCSNRRKSVWDCLLYSICSFF